MRQLSQMSVVHCRGSVTGLQVVNSSGQPGTAPSITLRGGASITGSAPALIIVDGVERTLSEITHLISSLLKS